MQLPEDYLGSVPSTGVDIPARPQDVASTKAIIDAMYECLSGSAGQPRDWNRMKSLCVTKNHSIRTGKLPDGRVACKIMSTDEYIHQMDSWLLENGFFETEIHRTEERFGNIAHVMSTYESRHNANDPRPYMRGINSFQLLFDEKRWWVINVMWQHESEEFPIPASFLPQSH